MACTETFLDECVKYTGANAPSLGINTNDSLLVVEESLITSLTSVLDNLSLYVQKSEFCCLLETCTSSIPVLTLASDKMLPYAVVPYYGPTTGYPTASDTFSNTGAGTGYWANVYMCNGQNGTPDLRGRVPVGATDTPSTNLPLPDQTNPGYQGNPTYTYGLTPGKNTITLELPQIPAHNHTGSTAITTIPPHTHTATYIGPYIGSIFGGDFEGGGSNTFRNNPLTTDPATLTATTSLTIGNSGNDQAHNNYQPGLALYYIQYRPV